MNTGIHMRYDKYDTDQEMIKKYYILNMCIFKTGNSYFEHCMFMWHWVGYFDKAYYVWL